jgi:hypothetical protein
MSYDIRPLHTLTEKEALLQTCAKQGDIIFFEHDPIAEIGTVHYNEQGRIVLEHKGDLSSFL